MSDGQHEMAVRERAERTRDPMAESVEVALAEALRALEESRASMATARVALSTALWRLRQDGETAARILPAVLRLGSHLSDGQGYEIAWAIARSTRQHGLRPELVAALISVESGYRPGVVSPTNDHGLMQIHGEPVYDIERNIALGCEELATWRATYDCGEREMLAHYNGGCNPPGVSWSYADRVLGLAEQVRRVLGEEETNV